MKAILEYTDHLISHDGKQVYKILAENNIEVIKTKQGAWSSEIRVLIRIENYHELNLLIAELNKHCINGVKLIKVKHDSIFRKLRRKQNGFCLTEKWSEK